MLFFVLSFDNCLISTDFQIIFTQVFTVCILFVFIKFLRSLSFLYYFKKLFNYTFCVFSHGQEEAEQLFKGSWEDKTAEGGETCCTAGNEGTTRSGIWHEHTELGVWCNDQVLLYFNNIDIIFLSLFVRIKLSYLYFQCITSCLWCIKVRWIMSHFYFIELISQNSGRCSSL